MYYHETAFLRTLFGISPYFPYSSIRRYRTSTEPVPNQYRTSTSPLPVQEENSSVLQVYEGVLHRTGSTFEVTQPLPGEYLLFLFPTLFRCGYRWEVKWIREAIS